MKITIKADTLTLLFIWSLHQILFPGLLLCLLVAGCSRDTSKEISHSSDVSNQVGGRSLRYLALGDSYTIGTNVDSKERWPNQLVELLQEDKIDIVEPIIIAGTGWTTDGLLTEINNAELKSPYDLVSVLIGVNNQYQRRDVNEYRLQLRHILQLAVKLAGDKPKRVIVLSIPDWGVTPFALRRGDSDIKRIAQEIDRFNAVKKAEAKRLDVHYIDITPGTRKAKNQHQLFASDGLHPSGEMYAQWAKAAFPVARQSIDSSAFAGSTR